jgi:hypothetical protein
VECINRWIEQGLMRPLDPMLLMMSIWSLTQYFADFEYQARYMLRVKEGLPLDRAYTIDEVTTFVMLGWGVPSRTEGPSAFLARCITRSDDRSSAADIAPSLQTLKTPVHEPLSAGPACR